MREKDFSEAFLKAGCRYKKFSFARFYEFQAALNDIGHIRLVEEVYVMSFFYTKRLKNIIYIMLALIFFLIPGIYLLFSYCGIANFTIFIMLIEAVSIVTLGFVLYDYITSPYVKFYKFYRYEQNSPD